jgi:acetate kinase
VPTLVVNAGSTSLKLSVVERSGAAHRPATLDDALADGEPIDVIVHRVVHGGDRARPQLIDDDLVVELEALAELAPLHQPPALELIARCRERRPDVAQYAVFDTSFHTTIPAAASTYAIPRRWRPRVRAYGFHGISHSWSTHRIAQVAPSARRVVVAHLGGGASLCAARDARSVMTTMGFTPLDGLVMATRSGTIDPGALLWLARHAGDVEHMLTHESGLLGLCGAADMRVVLERGDAGDADARLAVDVYVHRLVTSIGACVACLGGLDALVFTGGVGEGSARIRELTATRLEWLGVRLRPVVVGDDVSELSAPGAPVRTFVVAAREDLEMVRLVGALDTGDTGA